MKKALLLVTTALCALLFLAACGGNAQIPAATIEATQAPTAPQYPDLPQLTLRQLHHTMSRVLPPVKAIQGTTSWRWENTSINKDSAHPLQAPQNAFDEATLADPIIYLDFSYPPQSMEVRRWPMEYLLLPQDKTPFERYEVMATEVDDGSPVFIQDGGDYIYEVIARWPNGQSRYSFRVNN